MLLRGQTQLGVSRDASEDAWGTWGGRGRGWLSVSELGSGPEVRTGIKMGA